MLQEAATTDTLFRARRPAASRRASRLPHHEIEALLISLRGEALLIATLAYGLRVKISSLLDVRVRDVDVFEETIVVSNRARRIPHAITEDMREFLQERICGCDASDSWGYEGARSKPSRSYSVRDDLLFSEEAFAVVRRLVVEFQERTTDNARASYASRGLDSYLRILGWLQYRAAKARGIRCDSPLDLFNKGPRIVRRGRGGVAQGYYLWRAQAGW